MKQENNLINNIQEIMQKEKISDSAGFIISNTYLYLINKKLIEQYGEYDLKTTALEISKNYSNESIDSYHKYLDTLSIDEIKEIIYFVLSNKTKYGKNNEENISDNLSDLVIRLLNINNNEENVIFDMGSGNGNFLANVYKYSLQNNILLKDLLGVEQNKTQAYLSNMAMQIIRSNNIKPIIKNANVLEDSNIQYTHAYLFPSFGSKFLTLGKYENSKYPDIKFSIRNSTEWIFIDKLLKGNPQKSVAIVTTKALYNNADKEYRNKIIEDGLLEGIIELPSGLFDSFAMKTYILVFSNNNTKVKLLDASSTSCYTYTSFRKLKLQVEKILSMYNDTDCQTLTNEECTKSNNLIPSKALIKIDENENTIKLSDVADIFLGSQYTSRNFIDMFTDKNTGYKILTAKDIESGIVNWKTLQNINYKDNKFDKYAIHKNDVIVTSKTSKIKIAVVDIEPKEKILVTGGMIIIRPNTEKIDPTFIKIYLDSEQGQLKLKSIQKGTVIISFTAKDLSNISIPDININLQREKAELYNSKLSSLIAYKNEIEKIENKLANFYLDEFQGK